MLPIAERRGGRMTKMIKICAAAGLIACSGGALAQEDKNEAVQAAVKDIAHEIVECAVYFDIVATVLRTNDPPTSLKYVEAYKLAIARADSLSPGMVKAQYAGMAKAM